MSEMRELDMFPVMDSMITEKSLTIRRNTTHKFCFIAFHFIPVYDDNGVRVNSHQATVF